MRKTLLMGLSALALTTSFAAPAVAAELGGGFTINGGAAVVSDYRFRGISQSFKSFAIQGNVSVSHKSGFYATVWGSSIDDYVANGADLELDLILGYKRAFGGTTLDVGVLYYYYPSSDDLFPGYKSDFFEPYVSVSHTFGPVTAKVTANYAPKQKAVSTCGGFYDPLLCTKEDSLYLGGDLSAAIPGTPVTVTAHLGHTFGPSWLSPVSDEYTDWSIGASYTTGPLTLGVSYVDTDKDLLIFDANGSKNIMKGGVVGSVSVAF